MKWLKRQHAQKLKKEALKKQKNQTLTEITLKTGSAAIIALTTQALKNNSYAGPPCNHHWVQVVPDIDQDYIEDSEETSLGMQETDPDENSNWIPDGVELAKICCEKIDELTHLQPSDPTPDYLHVVEHKLKGLEDCEICGESLNMGYMEVKDPQAGISINVYYICHHFMKHGSFSYDGTINQGRVDVVGLAQLIGVTLPPSHMLSVPDDSDLDYMSNAEESQLEYNPDDADENHNTVPDGADLAMLCALTIDSLPVYTDGAIPETTYTEHHPQWGLEECEICGESINMGIMRIINPALSLEIDVPYVSQHSMRRGCFTCNGTEHDLRLDVDLLVRVLGIQTGDLHLVPVSNDSDEDLLSDAEENGLGTEPFNSDQDMNDDIDGIQFAHVCAHVIERLPFYPAGDANDIYVIRHEVDGLEQCEICGDWIHMGGSEIMNDRLGLRYPETPGTFLPDVAIHSMKHGSLDYFGTEPGHADRVEILRLMRVLEMTLPHNDNLHQLPLTEPDTDFDKLTNQEEIAAKSNLYNPDQNSNLIPDGVEAAKRCKEIIDGLPQFSDPEEVPPGYSETYKIGYYALGLDTCPVCGEDINMGFWQITNPSQAATLGVLFIEEHYLEHGSFEYDSSVVSRGRVGVNPLLEILEIPKRCGDLGTIYRPADLNKDCHVDLSDLVDLSGQWLMDTEP